MMNMISKHARTASNERAHEPCHACGHRYNEPTEDAIDGENEEEEAKVVFQTKLTKLVEATTVAAKIASSDGPTATEKTVTSALDKYLERIGQADNEYAPVVRTRVFQNVRKIGNVGIYNRMRSLAEEACKAREFLTDGEASAITTRVINAVSRSRSVVQNLKDAEISITSSTFELIDMEMATALNNFDGDYGEALVTIWTLLSGEVDGAEAETSSNPNPNPNPKISQKIMKNIVFVRT